MTPNDVLNLNKYQLRHRDRFVVVLKSGDRCFTLGEYPFHAWICGEIDLNNFVYINMCLDRECEIQFLKLSDTRLIKMYIDAPEIQDEILLMENKEYDKYNRRLKNV